jgi:methyltransferase
MTPLWPHLAILGFVTAQRMIELPIARANTARLIAAGGHEDAPGQPISLPLLALFALVEVARVWVLWTLGPRWTTRIIVVPGERLVARGPYRFVSHPNYVVVAAEIALLPLVFGLWQIATLFTLLNAAVLAVRISAENRALGRST